MKATLTDFFGSDLKVVNAARCSFNKMKHEFDEKDAALIKFLATHEHTAPFRHCGATFIIECPIFVARQLQKHQVGMSVSEVSGRYVEFSEAWEPDHFRDAAPNVKQGSLPGIASNDEQAKKEYIKALDHAFETYNTLLHLGVAKEQARAILPLSTMTTFWMTGSLQAFAHLYNLRGKSDAQAEAQEIARQIDSQMVKLFSVSWKALTNQT